MSPDERTARCRALARDVRRAISDLTHDDPLLLTSIQEVARHLGENDGYLLCEAFEIVIASREIHVASGVVSIAAARAPALTGREQRRSTRLRGVGSRRHAKSQRLRSRFSIGRR